MSAASAQIRIVLRGSLTIAACEAAHLELARNLAAAGSVVIETDGDAEVDLSFVQLLIAAQRSAERAGRVVALAAPPAGGLAEALISCGFQPAPNATDLKDVLLISTRSAA
jgi:ABC-type transporter Mla MlaB component